MRACVEVIVLAQKEQTAVSAEAFVFGLTRLTSADLCVGAGAPERRLFTRLTA